MSDNRFVEVDRNMVVETSLGEPDIQFYDVRQAPFELYGLYRPQTEDVFKRLPDDVAAATSAGVRRLALHTAGGRVRFATDSDYIAIKCVMPYVTKYSHFPLTGTSAFDLYEDTEGGCRYRGCFIPPVTSTDGYESLLRIGSWDGLRKTETDGSPRMRYFTINFPSYNAVTSLYIGLRSDAHLEGGRHYINDRPVVYYGSSITQGGCASHAGNCYQNIIARRTGLDYINLGFSGNGRAEDSIVDYMAGLDMLAFVSDYDHNAPNVDHLRATHQRMYERIRAAHPDIPYIMLSRPDFDAKYDDSVARRSVVIDTYRHARSLGDRHVYYIDGQGIFRGPDEELCTVEGTHPTDVGFMKMADTIERILVRALRHGYFND